MAETVVTGMPSRVQRIRRCPWVEGHQQNIVLFQDEILNQRMRPPGLERLQGVGGGEAKGPGAECLDQS